MKKGIIDYSRISEFRLHEIIGIILDTPKLSYGKITVADLQVADLPSDRIYEKWEYKVFGYGVYFFFDKGLPIYIGKADSNFKHRFLSHRNFDGRPKYGFNELARRLAEKNGLCEAAYERNRFENEVIPMLEELEVVLINCSNSNIQPRQCSRLENIFMIGYARAGYTLLNSVPKRINKYSDEKSIEQLMNFA